MSTIMLRIAAAAALMPLLSASPQAQAAAATVGAEQGWSAVARCAQSDSERARHTCLDKVLRDAGLLTNEMHAQQQRRTFGLDERPAAPAPRPPSPTPPPAAASPRVTVDAGQPDRLEIEIASVQKAPDGKLAVTTTEGAVWRQTESVEMPQPPMAGDRMAIRKGAMSGYRCSLATTHLTFRCTRSR